MFISYLVRLIVPQIYVAGPQGTAAPHRRMSERKGSVGPALTTPDSVRRWALVALQQ